MPRLPGGAFSVVEALPRYCPRDVPGATGGVVASFGALGAGFDALENVCLLLTLDGSGARYPLFLATIFASCKFILLTVAIAYLLAGPGDADRQARRRGAGVLGHRPTMLGGTAPSLPTATRRSRRRRGQRCKLETLPGRSNPHT